MTTRWYPVSDDELFVVGAGKLDLDAIRARGLEVCSARKECDVHPGEPEACYRCL